MNAISSCINVIAFVSSAVLLSSLMLVGTAHAQPPDRGDTLATPQVVVNICYENSDILGPKSAGLLRVAQLIQRTLLGMGTRRVATRIDHCDKAPIRLRGCFADRRDSAGVIACRADDVAQLMLMAHFAERLEQQDGITFWARRARTGTAFPTDAANNFVRHAVANTPDPPKLLDWLSKETGMSHQTLKLARSQSIAWLRTRPTQAESSSLFAENATMLMMEFILGHELFHATGNRQCAQPGQARSEENGLWSFAIESMSTQQLFCAKAYASDEARADRCGLRAVRHGPTAKRLRAAKTARRYASYAAELAADVLGWALLTRHDTRLVSNPDEHFLFPNKDYLHPVLRNALVAHELVSVASPRKAWCDRMARAITIAIQNEVQYCPASKGDVDDKLLVLLPSGVVNAWNGAPWTPDAFACDGVAKANEQDVSTASTSGGLTDKNDASKGTFTDLGEVILEADLDRPFPEKLRYGGGGGLNMELMYNKYHQANLSICHKEVRRAVTAWASKKNLPLLREEQSGVRTLLHLASAEPKGFFEVIYRTYPEYRSIHLYFGFYDASHTRLVPTAIKSLMKSHDLSEFVTSLRTAASCSNDAKL